MISELPGVKTLVEQPHKLSVEDLTQEHYNVLSQAICNVLFTSSAELAYVQIIDGAPLSETYKDIYDLAVYPLRHKDRIS